LRRTVLLCLGVAAFVAAPAAAAPISSAHHHTNRTIRHRPAATHHISFAELTCAGGLTFSYNGDAGETFTIDWEGGRLIQHVFLAGLGTYSEAVPAVAKNATGRTYLTISFATADVNGQNGEAIVDLGSDLFCGGPTPASQIPPAPLTPPTPPTPGAATHHITFAELTCAGGLTFTYDGDAGETFTIDWQGGKLVQHPFFAGFGTYSEAVPAVAKSAAGGTYVTISFATVDVNGQNGQAIVDLGSDLSCGKPTPPPPPPPPPPPHHHKHHHPRCRVIKVSSLHVSVGPQGLLRGNATLDVSAPSATTITVTIFRGSSVTYTHRFSGSSLKLPMDVTSPKYWGIDTHCGCTYNTHAKIVVTASDGCSTASDPVYLNNQDPLAHRRHRL
jgi:hypothetical protein